VQIHPLGQENWSAIPGAANMDGDPAEEIVVVLGDTRLVIVDSETGEIQFDSQPYGWTDISVPGWTRNHNNDRYNYGYNVFCDEDGDGVYCAMFLVSVASVYVDDLAIVCLDRVSTAVPTAPSGTPLGLNLRTSYPNPSGARTRIDFSLPEPGHASLRVFDPEGRMVRMLVDGDLQAGDHMAVWNGEDDEGRPLASGTYYYELEADGRRTARTSVMLR